MFDAKIEINNDFVKRVLGNKENQVLYLEKYFQKYNINKTIPNVKINIDANKNIFITKGESSLYPCFVSHMDEVTSNTKESDRTIMKMNNVFIGMNKNTGKYAGCPGD